MIRREPHRPDATDTLSRALSCLPLTQAQTNTESTETAKPHGDLKLSPSGVNSDE